jgi:hypothetical protein
MEGILSLIVHTDIDMDFADRDAALSTLAYVPASMVERGAHRIKQGSVVKHQTGVYFQDAPIDPLTGLCSILYEDAAELGYFKIDFLNNSIYQGVRDEDHLDALVKEEPVWELFEMREVVGSLAHIKDHFGTVQVIKPKCIEDLAVVLALIRPAKRHLIGRSREEINSDIWKPEPGSDDGYRFKRAHAIAYAVSIVVQLNLMSERAVEAMNDDTGPSIEEPDRWEPEELPDWV